MPNAIRETAGTRPVRTMGVLFIFLATCGCITSPVWNYGATKEAKEDKLVPCPDGLIDDGEDGDTRIIVQDGRDGYWFSFVDPWGSTIGPKRRFEMSEGGPGDSRYAARMQGKLASTGESIYAGMGFAFTNPKTPFDISHARGISFWAKGTGKIRFKMPDRNTDPGGDRCKDCYNDFGVDIYLQDEWLRYTIPFDKMTQQPGWGDRAPALDTKGTLVVQWQFYTPGREYDVWIDNVELVGCRADEEAK